MGCGCKKKHVIPVQPGPPSKPLAPPPPQPTTAPKAHVVIREGTAIRPVVLPPKPLQQPQKELDRLLDKLRMITVRKPV